MLVLRYLKLNSWIQPVLNPTLSFGRRMGRIVYKKKNRTGDSPPTLRALEDIPDYKSDALPIAPA